MEEVLETRAALVILVLEFGDFVYGLHVHNDRVLRRVHDRDQVVYVLDVLSDSAGVDFRFPWEISVGQKLGNRG